MAIIKLHSSEVDKFLKSPEVQKMLADEAKKHAPKHPDIEIEPPFIGKTRARQTIRTQTMSGREALKKAFGG